MCDIVIGTPSWRRNRTVGKLVRLIRSDVTPLFRRYIQLFVPLLPYTMDPVLLYLIVLDYIMDDNLFYTLCCEEIYKIERGDAMRSVRQG